MRTMILYEIIFVLIVITISLGPPLILFHAKIKKSGFSKQKRFATLSGPLLSIFLAIVAVNVAGYVHASFMERGVPPLSSTFGEFFLKGYWLFAPLIVFLYCRFKEGKKGPSP